MPNSIKQGERLAIERMIAEGNVVIDVGAHIGEWTAAVLQVHPGIRAHLFEPLAREYRQLLSRFSKEITAGKVTLNQIALGQAEAFQSFYHYTQAPSWSTLHRRTNLELTNSIPEPVKLRVPVNTLDEYCRQNAIRRVHFLKIDVEGAEIEVLRGAHRLLQRGNVDFVQFEYGGTFQDSGYTLKECFERLGACEYLIFKLAENGFKYIPHFTGDLENYEYSNFIAAHPRYRALLLGEKPKMLDLEVLCKKHHVQPRGVIHIGAHEGKEYQRYREMGFKKIFFIEANPAVCRRLEAKVHGLPGVTTAQCAIANYDGTSELHVTSMDQSSSLLPLKQHKILYPSVTESYIETVACKKLDTLLRELGFSASDFNVLNIDIQGAELLALEGAQETLRHIEAINTEVNFTELYEGCALIEEVDDFLEKRGFIRAALTTPYHPSWGDAFYVRQPTITMSSLGSNGRFANQLFQYAFLKIYAREHDLRIETPPWAGSSLFGHRDPLILISRSLPEVRERSNLLSEAIVPNAKETFRNVDFWGYFQYNSRYYAPHRDDFRSLFQPAPDIHQKVQRAVDLVRSRGKTLVGLHLRRGDYGYEHFFVAPTEWYREWLRGFWDTLEEPVLFIASDEPEKVCRDFSDYNLVSSRDVAFALPGSEFYTDFYVLTQCHALAISNSSFSFAASMLNQNAKVFVRPHLPSKKLIPFDPWNSETIFRDAKVSQEAARGVSEKKAGRMASSEDAVSGQALLPALKRLSLRATSTAQPIPDPPFRDGNSI